jgi:hypothetical protein
MGLSQYEETSPLVAGTTIALADGTTPKSCGIPVTAPLRIDEVWVTSQSGTDHVVSLWVRISGNSYRWRAVNVPAGSGNGTLPSINVMAGVSGALAGIPLPATNYNIYVAVDVAMSGSDTLTVVTIAGIL